MSVNSVNSLLYISPSYFASSSPPSTSAISCSSCNLTDVGLAFSIANFSGYCPCPKYELIAST